MPERHERQFSRAVGGPRAATLTMRCTLSELVAAQLTPRVVFYFNQKGTIERS
jgi:hypothetical protein